MTFNEDAVVLAALVLFVATGFAAVYLVCRQCRLSGIFAACLAGLLFIELSFSGPLGLVVCPIWFGVHTPSRLALGTRLDIWPDPDVDDEDGTLVGTVLHLADCFVWSALVTGVVWVRHRGRRGDGGAGPCVASNPT